MNNVLDMMFESLGSTVVVHMKDGRVIEGFGGCIELMSEDEDLEDNILTLDVDGRMVEAWEQDIDRIDIIERFSDGLIK